QLLNQDKQKSNGNQNQKTANQISFDLTGRLQKTNHSVNNSVGWMRARPNFYYSNPAPGALSEELVFEQEIQGGDAIFPGDFLAFFVGAPVVRNGHLIDPAAQFGGLDG